MIRLLCVRLRGVVSHASSQRVYALGEAELGVGAVRLLVFGGLAVAFALVASLLLGLCPIAVTLIASCTQSA
jgi:hypothetical protein